VCSVFYWLIGNALLIYYVIVKLRLHIPWLDVCWGYGAVGLEWCPCCRLKLHRTKNKTTNVVIQQNNSKLLMMDISMSETY